MEKTLSTSSKLLLSKAIEEDAYIIISHALDGDYISIGNFSIFLDTKRKKADFDDAIEKLEDYNFIKTIKYDRNLFEVTKMGYDYYDKYVSNQNETKEVNCDISKGAIVESNNIKYEVLDFIGKGGFGAVYKIKSMVDDNIYALKTVTSESGLDSLKNEINAAIKINNENVVKYYSYFEGNEKIKPFIIMEYVDGGTLKDKISYNSTCMNFESVINYVMQIINGMKAINKVVVHRDIKPDNILITKDGIVKISDFGIAKFAEEPTRDLTFKNAATLKYVSPERLDFKHNTILSDIYSMGIVFYELATFKYPYLISNEDDASYVNAHKNLLPINPKNYNNLLPDYFISLLNKMLEKEPEKRYKNFEEIEEYINTNKNSEIQSEYIKNLLKQRKVYEDNLEKSKVDKMSKSMIQQNKMDEIKKEIDNVILNPLKSQVSQFNQLYTNGNIKISDKYSNNKVEIIITSLENRKTHLEFVIFGEDNSEYDLEKSKVIAWGRLYKEDGSGINLYLTKHFITGELEWKYSVTKNAVFSTSKRIEPICFTFEELPREIYCFDAFHIYDTNLNKLESIDAISPFIDFCEV